MRRSGRVVSRRATDLRTSLFSGDSLLSAKVSLWCQSAASLTRRWKLHLFQCSVREANFDVQQLSDMSPWSNSGVYRMSKPRPRDDGQAFPAWPDNRIWRVCPLGSRRRTAWLTVRVGHKLQWCTHSHHVECRRERREAGARNVQSDEHQRRFLRRRSVHGLDAWISVRLPLQSRVESQV